MSYAQAMKHHNNHRHDKNRQPIVMGFVDTNRDFPCLGSVWYEPGMDAEREAFIIKWRRERGRVCANCDQTENLVPYILNMKHCPACALKYKL